MRSIIRIIRQSLSKKLSLGILLMAVPIFMLSLGILYVESRDKVKKEATEHANSVLSTTMQRISRFMNSVETATDINEWDITENMDPDSVLAYSRYVVVLNGYVDGCSISMEPYVFPKIGKHFSAYTVRETDTITTVIEQEYDYFDKIWYKTPHQLDGPCWVVYYDDVDSLDLVLDGMIASYGKPLYKTSPKPSEGVGNGKPEKTFVGIISTDISLIRLSKVINDVKPYPDSYFFMTGEDGRYFIHPDSTYLFTHTIFSDADPQKNTDIIALGHEMTTGKKGNMSVVFDGKPCQVCYQPVPGTPWSLALVCPDRSILKSYTRLSYIITPLTAIGLLLIILLGALTVTHAMSPLNKLASKLQLIAAGHYDERIDHTRHQDVVGRLQNNFADMQESLSRHVGDIERMNVEAARRNEELVRTSELAKEADHQKMVFIQNVSHQLRTPLNIIIGFVQVLRDSKSMLSKEEADNILGMMKHNSMMLDRMTQMLFDSSARGNTEELYTQKTDVVSCNDVARECIHFILEYFPDQHISFTSDLADDFCIRTSQHYLMISIHELLYNAAKYSDGWHVSLHLTETGNSVRFIIEDTGPGIDEEDMDRLFDFFTKVNDLSEGLGLGLPLAKRHVDNLDGEIILDTTYHEGCRFIIQLPKL